MTKFTNWHKYVVSDFIDFKKLSNDILYLIWNIFISKVGWLGFNPKDCKSLYHGCRQQFLEDVPEGRVNA